MSYNEAIQEAYALSKTDEVVLETLELQWRDEVLRFVSNYEDITATLETDEVVSFRAVSVAFDLPAKSEQGFQELVIAIANTNQEASDFLKQTLDFDDEITCLYRPYLASDLTTPQLNPPLELTLTYAEISVQQVDAKATFVDILNRSFLTIKYTRTSNPSL